jgi:hypothetical protein
MPTDARGFEQADPGCDVVAVDHTALAWESAKAG